MNLDDLEDAERFQRMVVTPMVDAVRHEVKSIVDTQAAHTEQLRLHAADIAGLKSNQKKALAGYAAIVMVVTLGFNQAKGWAMKKIGWQQ